MAKDSEAQAGARSCEPCKGQGSSLSQCPVGKAASPRAPACVHVASAFPDKNPAQQSQGHPAPSKRRKQAGDKEKCFPLHNSFTGNGFQSGHLPTRLASQSYTTTTKELSPNFITVAEKGPFTW